MQQDEMIEEVVEKSSNRRDMLKKIGMATAAVGAAASLGGVKLEAQSIMPADVLNFALNLEYLEAEFYSVATTGQTLAQRGYDFSSGVGTAGTTTTSYGKVNFGNNLLSTSQVAQLIAADELNHVLLLRNALGSSAIKKPAINLDALASMGASLSNQATFLVLSRIFEDIGVTAYAGAAQYLVSSPSILTTAARILATEALHVSNIRAEIAKFGLASPQLDPADVVPPPSGTNYFSTNIQNGLVATRTPGQVLYLAFGNVANAMAGGFFPNGVNASNPALAMSSTPATSANLS